MEYRAKWTTAKKGMDAAGIDSKKFFKEDLGPLLDAYEVKDAALDKIKGTDPAKLDAAKKARLEAYEKAHKVIASYTKALELFKKGLAHEPKKTKALDDAETVLTMQIFAPMRKDVTGKG